MLRAIQRLRLILRNGDIEYAELHGAFFKIVFGVFFLFSNIHMPIASGFLGIPLLALGIIQAFGIAFQNYHERRLASFCSVLAWLFIAALSFDPDQPWSMVTCPVFASFAVSSGWNFVRMGHRHEVKAKLLANTAMRKA